MTQGLLTRQYLYHKHNSVHGPRGLRLPMGQAAGRRASEYELSTDPSNVSFSGRFLFLNKLSAVLCKAQIIVYPCIRTVF